MCVHTERTTLASHSPAAIPAALLSFRSSKTILLSFFLKEVEQKGSPRPAAREDDYPRSSGHSKDCLPVRFSLDFRLRCRRCSHRRLSTVTKTKLATHSAVWCFSRMPGASLQCRDRFWGSPLDIAALWCFRKRTLAMAAGAFPLYVAHSDSRHNAVSARTASPVFVFTGRTFCKHIRSRILFCFFL